MSFTEPPEPTTVSENGVTLTKTVDFETYSIPVVVYDVQSTVSVSANVRIVETLPTDLAKDELGFHRDLGYSHWWYTDETLALKYELDPYETYRTGFGIWTEDAVTAFRGEPAIFEVEWTESGSEFSSGAKSERSSRNDGDPAVVAEPPRGPIGPNASTPRGEMHATPEEAPVEDTGSHSPQHSRKRNAVQEKGNVVDVLVAAIEDGTVSAEQREVLRQSITDAKGDEPLAARVERIERTVAKLDAYTESLEQFLGEHGNGTNPIDDLYSELESVDDAVTEIDATLAITSNRVSALEEDHERVESTVSAHGETVSDLSNDVERLHESVSADIDSRVKDLEADIRQINETWRRIRRVFESGSADLNGEPAQIETE